MFPSAAWFVDKKPKLIEHKGFDKDKFSRDVTQGNTLVSTSCQQHRMSWEVVQPTVK